MAKNKNIMNKNKGPLWVLIASAAVVFGVVAYVVIKSSQFTVAVVPNQNISSGTTITSSMLKRIQVPANTPKGYIMDETSLLGQKTKTNVKADQLMYSGNLMVAWSEFTSGAEIPKDYVVTSIKVPVNNAVNGMIAPGDSIDIAGIPTSNFQGLDSTTMSQYLGTISENSMGGSGVHVYWVLSNVKVLETDTAIAKRETSEGSDNQDNTQEEADENSYIIALNYSDYRKLLLAQQYLDLHLTITPQQGYNKDDITKSDIPELGDAQDQSKYKDEKKDEESDSTKSSDTESSTTESSTKSDN